jgi:hypothetical protein
MDGLLACDVGCNGLAPIRSALTFLPCGPGQNVGATVNNAPAEFSKLRTTTRNAPPGERDATDAQQLRRFMRRQEDRLCLTAPMAVAPVIAAVVTAALIAAHGHARRHRPSNGDQSCLLALIGAQESAQWGATIRILRDVIGAA